MHSITEKLQQFEHFRKALKTFLKLKIKWQNILYVTISSGLFAPRQTKRWHYPFCALAETATKALVFVHPKLVADIYGQMDQD